MAEIRTVVAALVCDECGHQWQPREGARLPKVCPRCKSYKWNAKAGAE